MVCQAGEETLVMVSLKSEGSWVGWQSQARVLAQEPRCGVHKGVTVPGRLKTEIRGATETDCVWNNYAKIGS